MCAGGMSAVTTAASEIALGDAMRQLPAGWSTWDIILWPPLRTPILDYSQTSL